MGGDNARQSFAAAALTGMLANADWTQLDNDDYHNLARDAFQIAGEMLLRRGAEQTLPGFFMPGELLDRDEMLRLIEAASMYAVKLTGEPSRAETFRTLADKLRALLAVQI